MPGTLDKALMREMLPSETGEWHSPGLMKLVGRLLEMRKAINDDLPNDIRLLHDAEKTRSNHNA